MLFAATRSKLLAGDLPSTFAFLKTYLFSRNQDFFVTVRAGTAYRHLFPK